MAERSITDVIEKAWARRFHKWRGYALSLTGNWMDAEDVVQEAVIRTVHARPRLETERDANNYILVAVRTAALQLFESRRRVRPLEDEGPVQLEGAAPTPLEVALGREARDHRQELQERALQAMAELTDEQRQAVELLVLREPPLKLREVGTIQDAPISTVHSRLQAALRELGRLLDGED
ncbi:MAG: RNA polymerase sigma factor [Acidobacteriota bacterium]